MLSPRSQSCSLQKISIGNFLQTATPACSTPNPLKGDVKPRRSCCMQASWQSRGLFSVGALLLDTRAFYSEPEVERGLSPYRCQGVPYCPYHQHHFGSECDHAESLIAPQDSILWAAGQDTGGYFFCLCFRLYVQNVLRDSRLFPFARKAVRCRE